MISFLFYMTVKDGLIDEFTKWSINLVRATRAEDEGCITYIFHQEIDNPRKFVLYEQWRDEASLKAHLKRMQRVYGAPPLGEEGETSLPAKMLDFFDEHGKTNVKIALGVDKSGFVLKEVLIKHLEAKGIEVQYTGVHDCSEETPYYEIASEVARKVSNREVYRGVLVCGTGMGMAIVANKFPNVYAAVCENNRAAEESRKINDSNVLTMGGWRTEAELAKNIVDIWLGTDFAQGCEKSTKEWLQNSIQEIRKLEPSLK